MDHPQNIDGITEWFPPPHLDTSQKRINDYHHPDRLFRRGHEDCGDEDCKGPP